jgi:hypothetical protein
MEAFLVRPFAFCSFFVCILLFDLTSLIPSFVLSLLSSFFLSPFCFSFF